MVRRDLKEEKSLSEDVRKYKYLCDKHCSGCNENLAN